MITTRLRKSFLHLSEEDDDAANVIPDTMDEEGIDVFFKDESTEHNVPAPDLPIEQDNFIARLRKKDDERNEQYKVAIHCSHVFCVNV